MSKPIGRRQLSASITGSLPSTRRSAKKASLVYTNDAEPGIRRKSINGKFSYFAADGRKLRNRKSIARIHSLAIPPAWTDVWISPEADGHLQATGRDKRGRKQYRYHPRWSDCRDEVKFSSLAAFARSLPLLRRRIDADLRRRQLSRERVVASVVWLLDNALIRVGNAAYARENNSFGLTTLRDRHVEITGSTLRFAFKGKSGKEWRLKLTDRRIARVVRGAQDLPGQHLFQYLDECGERHTVTSQDVNDYIREATDAEFTSKHFRTWAGTVRAFTLLTAEEKPETDTMTKRVLNGIIEKVASRLGNTRAVCRKCYIHPRLIESWRKGTLPAETRSPRGRPSSDPHGLDDAERRALRWLGD